jgi:hypothetical protein
MHPIMLSAVGFTFCLFTNSLDKFWLVAHERQGKYSLCCKERAKSVRNDFFAHGVLFLLQLGLSFFNEILKFGR